jgi:hypothetical protein
MKTLATLEPVTSISQATSLREVLVVSIDDHPTAVFDSEEAVLKAYPELKFTQHTPSYWKAITEQLNSVYVEKFIVQHS